MSLAKERYPDGKRASRVPRSRASLKLVMDELARHGFDARTPRGVTKKYDLLVGTSGSTLKPIHVRTVHFSPWYVRSSIFVGVFADQVTVYVLLGLEANERARFFLVRNKDLQEKFIQPANWDGFGLIDLAGLMEYENNWDVLAENK